MKITVQFRYWNNEIPKRCRKARNVEHTNSATFFVPELMAHEAPVAIRTTEPSYPGEKTRNPQEYRWYNGQLYLPSMASYAGPPREKPRKILSEYRLSESGNRFRDGADLYAYVNPYGYCGDPWKGENEVIARIARTFSVYVLIDGVLYEEAGEPRYVIMTYGLGHNHGIGWGTSISVDTGYNSNIAFDRYFPINQRQECIEEATRVALARGDTNAIPVANHIYCDVEILIPEAVQVVRKSGGGDPFINGMERMINGTSSASEAGVLALAVLASSLK